MELYDFSKQLTVKLDYDGGTNAIYIGEVAPGTATSIAGWRIKKLTYDVNNNVTDVQYADGNVLFDNVWDDRASLSYS